MSDRDEEDLPTSRLRGNEHNIDPESGYSRTFKNKMGSRRSYYIVLTLLIFVFAVLVIAVSGLSYAYITNIATKSAPTQDRQICTSEDCLRSATSFIESMNTSVNPCEDFYQFACGKYPVYHSIPKTSMSNDRFDEVHSRMLVHIREFMEKEDSDSEPFSVSQSRLLYRSCMATDEMDAAGLNSLLKLLDQIGLPHLGVTPKSSSNKKDLNLSTILAGVKKYVNVDFLFTTSVDTDPKNRTNNRITLSKPRDTNMYPAHKIIEKMKKMSSRKIRETLASEENVDNEDTNEETKNAVKAYEAAYVKYVNGIWMEIYKSQSNISKPSLKDPKERTELIREFNSKFSDIKDKVYDTDDELPVVMSVKELQEFTDKITNNNSYLQEQIIDWKEYLQVLFDDVSIELDFETDFIQINNIEYFEALFKFLASSKKSIKILNLWWEVVTTVVPYTTNQMRFIQDRFYYETTGLENNPSRSLYCANAVNTMMGMAVSHLLINMKSLEIKKNMMKEMMENIHWAFEVIVRKIDWMDETTKKRTLEKAMQMKTFVGFPEFIAYADELDDYYYDFTVLEYDYFGNVIRYVQRDLNNTLLGLRQTNDYTINSWASDPLEVNAYNWIQANAITIPAGILQFPFFGHDLQVLNYGFLGSILGHELTHGFDNTGRKFDKDGNEHMWWTDQTIEEYEKRTDCFVHHYESYLIPEINEKINGKLTLDENIADNGGLREALLGYRKYVADHGEEPKLPGLEEFTNDQMYYLAFANNWCEATTFSSLSNSLSDEHSPNYIRVIAALTNSEEFSQVWNCKKGSRMNPNDQKCEIW